MSDDGKILFCPKKSDSQILESGNNFKIDL